MRVRSAGLADVTCAALLGTLIATGTAHADERVDLGIFGGAHVFSDSNELGAFDAEHDEAPGTNVMAGVRVGVALHWLLSVEAEAASTPTSTRGMADVSVLAHAVRLHALLHFTKADSDNRPFAVVGGGFMMGQSDDERVLMDDTDEMFHAGLGFKRYFGNWGLRVDARVLFPPSTEDDFVTTDFEAFAGLYYVFGRKPAERIEVEPIVADTDGDGIKDDVDQCKDDPEDVDGFEDTDGCPDNDNDGDGLADNDDQCPMKAETKNGIDDDDGCPEEDGDGDGIVGSADQCPDEPEDKDEYEDEDGCPDDNDGDGIADIDDKCVDEPETVNQYEDDDGCPDTVPVAVKKFTGTIKGITFERNKAIIRKTSHKILDEAVKVMTEYPNMRIEIQGHTDTTGSEELNADLSQRRADAVKAYLVDNGIAEDRLEAKGYGEAEPVADNSTKAGRAKNRRVDFVLISKP